MSDMPTGDERIQQFLSLIRSEQTGDALALPDAHSELATSSIDVAADVANIGVARLLLERGANPNDGESLHHTAQHHHRACLDLLVAHGANTSG